VSVDGGRMPGEALVRGPDMLRDNVRYRARPATMAACHLREHRSAGMLRFPVIRQLRARRGNGPRATCCQSTRSPATSTTSSPTWPTRTSRGTRTGNAPTPRIHRNTDSAWLISSRRSGKNLHYLRKRRRWRLVVATLPTARLRQGGADLAQVQALLGHASIDTAARYFRTGSAEKAEVVERVFAN
jgi:integrase